MGSAFCAPDKKGGSGDTSNYKTLFIGGKTMHTIKKGESKFYVGENEQEPLAEITFKPAEGNKLIVDHTIVSEELQGQGMAGKLVEKVVSYARDEGKKVIPECSYAKSKMEKTPEYHDVLAGE